MALSTKFIVFIAVLLVLEIHWATCQFYGGYPGYPNVIRSCDRDDNDLDTILPILLLTLFNRGGYGGGCGCGGGCGGRCGC